jgi:hypothetical protein
LNSILPPDLTFNRRIEFNVTATGITALSSTAWAKDEAWYPIMIIKNKKTYFFIRLKIYVWLNNSGFLS